MNRSTLVFNTLIVLMIAGLAFYCMKNTKKIAYINTAEVFNAFAMTKEIDKEVKKVEEQRQGILDSLVNAIKQIQAGVVKVENNKFEYIKEEYVNKRTQFTEDIGRLKQSSIEKVWKQINQYVMELGKEKNYDVILGANGQGALMYAKEGINITNDVIQYINEKYEGTAAK